MVQIPSPPARDLLLAAAAGAAVATVVLGRCAAAPSAVRTGAGAAARAADERRRACSGGAVDQKRTDSTIAIDQKINSGLNKLKVISPAARAPKPSALGASSDGQGGEQASAEKVLVIGVCGGSGSGKSTVSEKLHHGIGAHHLAYVCHDWYYRDQSHVPDMAVRAAKNYDHPDALETDLMVEHIKELKQMKDVYVPDYDFAHHTRFGGLNWRETHARLVTAAPVVLVEGILLLENPELREIIDIRVFVDADADLRFMRRMMRDISERERQVEDVVEQFSTTVRPMHNLFVEPMKRYAHVVLPMNEPNETADKMMLTVVAARVEEAKAHYNAAVRADFLRWEAQALATWPLTDAERLQVVASFRLADQDQDGALDLAACRNW